MYTNIFFSCAYPQQGLSDRFVSRLSVCGHKISSLNSEGLVEENSEKYYKLASVCITHRPEIHSRG